MDEPKAHLLAMLAHMKLIGLPHCLVVGDRSLEIGAADYKGRCDPDTERIA